MGLTMRPPLLAAFLLIVALAACHRAEEDNIQERAQNTSERLEQRYNEFQAEAENSVDSQIAPLDNETANLLNQMNGAMPAAGNDANAAAPPP
jgi:hypothetical protein